MIEQDTINLLKECNSGVKMGIKSIDEVLNHVHSNAFKRYLTDCKNEHIKLDEEIQELLNHYQEDEKKPNPIVSSMSSMKVNMKLMMNNSDQTIASLMTDGCNMGVKSLNSYLNEYQQADDTSKEIAMRLIKLEERLAVDIRQFL